MTDWADAAAVEITDKIADGTLDVLCDLTGDFSFGVDTDQQIAEIIRNCASLAQPAAVTEAVPHAPADLLAALQELYDCSGRAPEVARAEWEAAAQKAEAMLKKYESS